MADEVVRLNVGGTIHATTRHTLIREPDSLFHRVLAGEIPEDVAASVLKLDDGTTFIDRDGSLFSHVLQFLRSGKLVLPDHFNDIPRLREEAIFYGLDRMLEQLTPTTSARDNRPSSNGSNSADIGGGYITLGYRGTFAFGRDGQADVKFRKLHRILVCGKVSLCREIFGDTLNESRDPGDRENCVERYTSRLYLKHQCLERACDLMAEKGFKLVATCCSGANGLATPNHPGGGTVNGGSDLMNHRNCGDYEEQRWAHYTEYVFYRDGGIGSSGSNGGPSLSPELM